MESKQAKRGPEEPKSDLGKLEQSVKGVKEMMAHHEKNKTKFKIILGTIFTVGVICFGVIWTSAPKLTEAEQSVLKFPRTPSDLQGILSVVLRYNNDNRVWVTSIWVYLYVL